MHGTEHAALPVAGDGLGIAGLCDAEIRQHGDAFAVEQYVLGLDVAVNDVCIVRHLKRRADLPCDGDGGIVIQRAVLLDEGLERHAVHIFHHDKACAILLAHIVDIDQVFMRNGRSGFGLLLKAAHKLRVLAVLIAQHLDGDRSTGAEIIGLVDDGHAALADNLPQQITSLEAGTLHRATSPPQ